MFVYQNIVLTKIIYFPMILLYSIISIIYQFYLQEMSYFYTKDIWYTIKKRNKTCQFFRRRTTDMVLVVPTTTAAWQDRRMSSAVKTYNFPTHKGFCHNFPTKLWYYHTRKNATKACISIFRKILQVQFFPFYKAYSLIVLYCICIKLDGVVKSKSPNR